MKVETVQTTTLYLTLAAGELALVRESAWLEFPCLSHDLVLHPSPDLSPIHLPSGESGEAASGINTSQFLARIQLRADYLSSLDLRAVNDDALELRVSPQEVPNLNRNLVGPVVPLDDLPSFGL